MFSPRTHSCDTRVETHGLILPGSGSVWFASENQLNATVLIRAQCRDARSSILNAVATFLISELPMKRIVTSNVGSAGMVKSRMHANAENSVASAPSCLDDRRARAAGAVRGDRR